MGTKNNPGKFDCYAKAEPDEPIFTLRAKDPLAATLVRQWAHRALATEEHSHEKVVEALNLAKAMDAWRFAKEEAEAKKLKESGK